MKISPTWLTLMLVLSLTGTSLHAQEEETSEDKPAEETTGDAEKESDTEETDKEGDTDAPDSAETTDEEESADEPEEKAPKTWQERLVPSVAVSGLDPAPEVIVGQPSASTDDTPGKNIYFPYPPRPQSPLPPGWVLRPSEELPPITRNVTLADGRRVTLEFPAMELQPAPAEDGSMSMQEPGFDPRKVTQENTISHTLDQYIAASKKHRETIGETLREMEQILLSAPAAPRPPAPSRNNGEPSSPLLPPSAPR